MGMKGDGGCILSLDIILKRKKAAIEMQEEDKCKLCNLLQKQNTNYFTQQSSSLKTRLHNHDQLNNQSVGSLGGTTTTKPSFYITLSVNIWTRALLWEILPVLWLRSDHVIKWQVGYL